MSKYFVTAIGNAIIDILALVDDEFLTANSLSKSSMSLINQDRVANLINLKYEKIVSGGSAANTVVAMANFGVKTAFIGNVGDGRYGDMFHEGLSSHNVDFYCKNKTKAGTTARSFVLITPDKERTMCTYLGEASNIANEIDEEVIADSEILYLEGYLWDQASTITALKKAIKIARENDTKVAFTLSDSFCVDRHKEDFLELVNKIDILFANEEEIKTLTSSEKIELEKLKHLARKNENLIIAITRSAKDAVIFDNSKHEFHKVPTIKADNIQDVTGAGDAFAAGFLYGLYHKLSLKESAKTGHLFASNIIQNIGARFEENKIAQIKQAL